MKELSGSISNGRLVALVPVSIGCEFWDSGAGEISNAVESGVLGLLLLGGLESREEGGTGSDCDFGGTEGDGDRCCDLSGDGFLLRLTNGRDVESRAGAIS